MKFYLIVAKGKKQGLPIPIEVDLFLIGSGKSCQLRADHEDIGEQHCAFVMRDRKVFVRDLNSGHPTIVNGEPIADSEEWPLHGGDFIEVGPLKFMIQYREKELSKRDLEEWALKCLDLDNSRKITAMDRLEAASGRFGGTAGRSRGSMMQFGMQLNDVATMAALGAPPPVLSASWACETNGSSYRRHTGSLRTTNRRNSAGVPSRALPSGAYA